MKIFKLIPLVLLLVVGTLSETIAQKVGHLNANELLVNYPAMKSANSQLEAFKEQKGKQLETKAKDLETFYIATMKEAQSGTLSPIQQQQKEAELQKRQQELQKLEASAQQEIGAKQAELYEPIIEKVNAAIKKVGEDNGYDYIFDSSIGAILHFNSSDDLSALVKKELGL